MNNVNPRNVGVGVLIGILLGLAAIFSFNCSDDSSSSPFGPSGLPRPSLQSTPAPTSSSSADPTEGEDPEVPESEPPPPAGLETCGFSLQRSGVEDDGGHFFVPVSGANVDQVIIYVWIEKVNDGTKYGPFEANTNFVVDPPGYGTFNYQLAVELDTNGDGRADNNCQDDRHHGSFEQIPPPPPPPPPGCTGTNCQPNVCELPEFSLETSLEVSEQQACVIVYAPYSGTFTEGSNQKTGTQATFCFPRGDQDQTVVISFVPSADPDCDPSVTVTIPKLPPLCERDPSNEQCAPECEYGDPKWNGEEWDCPSCADVNPPNASGFSAQANFTTSGLCALVGGQHKNCRVDPLQGSITVNNQGPFSFKVKATSSISEYNADDPDFVKNTTTQSQQCGGRAQIGVGYNWKGHDSRYWYFTLEGPNGLYFKSGVIDGF